jgi:hypothetical protein
VIITEPVLMQADITVGTIFTGKALALDISVITTGRVTATGVIPTGVTAPGITPMGDMAMGVTATGIMVTGVIRAGVILMGVMAMEIIQAGVDPMVVMAMGAIPTGVNPVRATRNDLPERNGFILRSNTRQNRTEVYDFSLSGRGLSDCLRDQLHPAGLEPATL